MSTFRFCADYYLYEVELRAASFVFLL